MDPYATVQTAGAVPQPAGTGTAVIMAPAGAPTPMEQPAMNPGPFETQAPIGQPVTAGGGVVDKVSMILAVVGLLVVIGLVVVLAMMDVG